MIAPMRWESSSTRPIETFGTSSLRSRSTSGHLLSGMYAREQAEHFWPWYSKAPRMRFITVPRTPADGCMKMKSLPPVSPTMRGKFRYFSRFEPTRFQMLTSVS